MNDSFLIYKLGVISQYIYTEDKEIKRKVSTVRFYLENLGFVFQSQTKVFLNEILWYKGRKRRRSNHLNIVRGTVFGEEEVLKE